MSEQPTRLNKFDDGERTVTDFRQRLYRASVTDSSRFVYLSCDDRHFIVCRLTPHDGINVITVLLEAMQTNPVLAALTEGVDYRWEGASMISFASKSVAAAFYLLCPH